MASCAPEQLLDSASGGEEVGRYYSRVSANGLFVSWQHINLLGEYDFSDEKLQDSVGVAD
jgi:hypothetical protein